MKEGMHMQQDMRYVYEIYRQKSFSKAAQALFITQPALSIAISKLEASLGMPLFDRSTRPISLTPAGRIYLQTIEKTRALEQDLRHQLDDIRALRTGTITIGSSHFINACILPEILRASTESSRRSSSTCSREAPTRWRACSSSARST